MSEFTLFRLGLRAESAFGTPLAGDTLLGHLCWALRWRHGEAHLAGLLAGYTEGRPFAVLSDAFPAGYVPRPALPPARLGVQADPTHRKADKRRQWLPLTHAGQPLASWVAGQAAELPAQTVQVLTQNTIHRLTGTTDTGPFAPRQVERLTLPADRPLELHVVLDTARLPPDQLRQAMEDIGAGGYGRDASTGLGKFSVLTLEAHRWPAPAGARHALTLAPCAPDPERLLAEDCHYQPLTRFGRHGSLHALGGQPFKRPLLMLRTGAVLAWAQADATPPLFHGRGLGGVEQPLSAAEPATIHQGYAPVLPVLLPPAPSLAAA